MEGPVFNGGRIWWDRWLGRPAPSPPDAGEAEAAAGPDVVAEPIEAGLQ